MNKKVFSSGGGTQSAAVLVLSAQGKIDYPIHVFANVGDNAEDPATIAYVREVLKPYAAANGIEWVEVCRRDRDGNPIDLYDFTMQAERSVPIPVRMGGSGVPGSRVCTSDWKIVPVSKWVQAQIPDETVKLAMAAGRKASAAVKMAATEKDLAIQKKLASFSAKREVFREQFPIVLAKGISVDEAHRARSNSEHAFYENAYPLLDLGLSRAECIALVKDAGLPSPPKSSCWFCPFKASDRWTTMRREQPDLFAKAVEMEKTLSDRAQSRGRGKTYFTSRGTARGEYLDAVTSDQMSLFDQPDLDLDFCESGFCMT